MKHLVIGGARSGKSRFAEQCVLNAGKKSFYIATAQAGDAEMAKRIAQHQARRDKRWTLVEEPILLADALDTLDSQCSQSPKNSSDCVILVDCLTLWLSNCLHRGCLEQEKQSLLSVLEKIQTDVFLVSNEVGSGVVPVSELSRQFVDQCGWIHQDVAALCTHVTAVIAGLPLTLKEPDK